MDISQIIDDIVNFVKSAIIPNLSLIARVGGIILAVLLLLRILFPIIWENLLIGIIKLSDKKNDKK